MSQSWRGRAKRAKQARQGVRRLHTIARCLIRELQRKLSADEATAQAANFKLCQRVLKQKAKDRNKL